MSLPVSPWFLVLAGLLALAYALLLYFRDGGGNRAQGFADADPTWRRWRAAMGGLRFGVVAVLLLLLLDPLLRERRTEEEAPLLLVAMDHSASVVASGDSSAYAGVLAELDALQEALGKDYRVRHFAFGEALTEREAGTALPPDASSTNLEKALGALDDRFAGQNVGAIVLASDGLINRGSPPAYRQDGLNVPVYAIGLGDTTQRKDLRIDRVFANRIVYRGDRFAVQVDLSAFGASGANSRVQVQRIAAGGSPVLASEGLRINAGRWSQRVEWALEAEQTGVQHYRISVSPVPGEASTANNSYDLYVDVLEGRQEVLLLAAAPHPDLSAMRQILEGRGQYRVELVLADALDAAGGLEAVLEDKDLLVAHQIPSTRHRLEALPGLLQRAEIPVLYVLGAASDLTAFGAQQPVLRVRAGNGSVNQTMARANPDFSRFKPSAESLKAIESFPPLSAPFGDYRTAPEARVLLQQRIGRVNTDYPLLLFGEQNGRRIGVLAGEGLWRWRVQDFVEDGQHDHVDALMGQCFQFLGVKSDRRRFRVQPGRNVFAEGEALRFQGELYDAAYQPVNTPDATMVLRRTEAFGDADAVPPEGERFDFRFRRRGEGYALETGALPPGNYQYRAETRLDGETLVAEGRLSVRARQLETQRLEADHGLLLDLAARSQGSFLGPAAAQPGSWRISTARDSGMVARQQDAALSELLAERIRAETRIKPILHERVQTRSAIHWRWAFALVLLMLALEWVLRKALGRY